MREARVNQALRQLGEDYRCGVCNEQYYRERRRSLIEDWDDIAVTTSPSSSIRRDRYPADEPPTRPVPARGPSFPFGVVAGILAVAALAAGAVILAVNSGTRATPGVSAPVPAVPPGGEANRLAEQFLHTNRWDIADVGAFMAQWRLLPAAARAAALQQPAVRALRIELDQNIELAAQLAAEPNGEEAAARLEQLRTLAREIGIAP